jgi:hypothetical protein
VKTEEFSQGFDLNFAVGMTSAAQLMSCLAGDRLARFKAETSDSEAGISDAFESNLQ